MDFLINNIGWFFCIAIVSVLAFIGYKADNKEKRSNANPKYIPNKENNESNEDNKQEIVEDEFYYNPIEETKEESKIEENLNKTPQEETDKPINENKIDDEMAELYEPLKPMQNTLKSEQKQAQEQQETPQEKLIEENKNDELEKTIQQTTIVSNNEQQEEPQQIVPDMNNIENLNISLEDLENKKYNELINKMNSSTKEIQQPVEQFNPIEEKIKENPNDENQPPIEDTTTISNNEQQEESKPDIELEHEFENEIQQPVEQSEQEKTQSEQTTETVNQDVEEQQETIENQQPVENNQENSFDFNKSETNYNGEIPEIFTNTEQNNQTINEINHLENSSNETGNETNIYSDSIDDDIWKF